MTWVYVIQCLSGLDGHMMSVYSLFPVISSDSMIIAYCSDSQLKDT